MMDTPRLTALSSLLAMAALAGCDSSPTPPPKTVPKGAVAMLSTTVEAPAMDAPATGAASEVRAMANHAGQAARAAQDEPAEATSGDGGLRAQLLGLNRPAPAAEEAQAEPDEPKKVVRRRRAPQRAEPAEVSGAMLLPEDASGGLGLSDGEFQDAVGSWRGIQSCIAQNASRMNERSGALRVSFEINPDGTVSTSKVLGTSNAVAQVIAPCVERKARRLRFPAFSGDEITKEAKFVF